MATSKIQMKGGRGSISLEIFQEVEKNIGVKLPQPLYELIKNNDHGYPEHNSFNIKIPDSKKLYETGLHTFLSFHSWSLEGMLINYFERPSHFPQDERFVPFGITGDGDYLLLFYENGKSDMHPKVYFWAHEYFDIENGLIYISDTFDSFMNMLTGNKKESNIPNSSSSEHLKNLKTDKSTASIIEHIEKHIGEISFVINKAGIESAQNIQLDICVISPTKERNYYTLITCGMSNLPMTPPKDLGGENVYFCELMMCLPADWKITAEDLKDNKNSWPFEQLDLLAKYPYNNSTWLWSGHTVGIGRDPTPFASNTDFCAWLIEIPLYFPQEFLLLNVAPKKGIVFFNAYPLYKEEVEYKINHGVERLEQLINTHGINEVIDIHRKNLGKKSWWRRLLS